MRQLSSRTWSSLKTFPVSHKSSIQVLSWGLDGQIITCNLGSVSQELADIFFGFFLNIQIIQMYRNVLKTGVCTRQLCLKEQLLTFEMKNRTLADRNLLRPVCPVCSQFFSSLVWTRSFVFSVYFALLLFILMLSLFCCLSSVFSQAENKLGAWVHLVLLWNAIWSPECQPVLGCHLCHSLSQRYGTGAPPAPHIHPFPSVHQRLR